MTRASIWNFAAIAGLSFFAGCASLQSMPSKMKSFVSGKPNLNDPLAIVTANTEISDDFKIAKRELKSADATLLKYAQMREDMGNHSVALDRYREILADNPDSIDARLGIARVEYKTGRVHEAEEILKATARRHPQNLQVWIDMGKIQSEREQYAAAIHSLQRAVKLDSTSQVARFELGLALARNNQLDEAKGHLSFAVGDSAALYNIGYVLHDGGRDADAVRWFQEALGSYPDARTRKSAKDMIASLQNIGGTDEGMLVAETRPYVPSVVDVQQTSYEEWRESPTSEGVLKTTDRKVHGATDVQTVPEPGIATTSQVIKATRQMQPSLRQVVHASSPEAETPVWERAPTLVPAAVESGTSPVALLPMSGGNAIAPMNTMSYPPQWKSSQAR